MDIYKECDRTIAVKASLEDVVLTHNKTLAEYPGVHPDDIKIVRSFGGPAISLSEQIKKQWEIHQGASADIEYFNTYSELRQNWM